MTLSSIPIYLVSEAQLAERPTHEHPWIKSLGFKATPGSHCLIPNQTPSEGTAIAAVLVGYTGTPDTWTLGGVATTLPVHTYHLEQAWSETAATQLMLGWHLGQYRFDRYRQEAAPPLPTLMAPTNISGQSVEVATQAMTQARNLINTPANEMGPEQLEVELRAIAQTYQAHCHSIQGEDLLHLNYPMIHAVGKASPQAPRLLELRWGDTQHPKVTLVGKGVCFDTGGLDLKPANSMLMMKKDMGGAAIVIGLAMMIMGLNLPVCLRVLIPAVENSVAGNAMRPLDVLRSRQGMTVEVGNTDAEGRLVLADALWEAAQESPDLLIDVATLTGAARVALGTELPALFCNRLDLAQRAMAAGLAVDDPLWSLPLYAPYRPMLESKVADISNISGGSYGGAITAALFLQEFVPETIPWIHIDVMAWNLRALPGRPEGGEGMAMRALFEIIRQEVAST